MNGWRLAGIVGVLALVGLTGLLAAAETTLTRLGMVPTLRMVEEDKRGADALLWLVEHPARGINALLLLTAVTRLAAGALVALVALDSGPWAVVGGLAVLAATMFVVADVASRSYTLGRLERVGLRLAPVLAAVVRAVEPAVALLVRGGGWLSGRAGAGLFASDQELRRLIGTEEAPDIEADERAMIHSIFELGDTVCREIMVPRPDMVTVSADASLFEIVATAVEEGYSRIPVWEGERDNIVGIVYAKDLLQRLHQQGPPTAGQGPSGERAVVRRVQGASGDGDGRGWRDLMRTPTFVPESKRADELLGELRRRQVHQAIVVDEHGAVVGLVTIEDILEEIVGEILDEHDVEEPAVVRLDNRRLRVSARLNVHELNELLGTELPEEDGWDTVGGLLVGLLGRVPDRGETVTVEGVTLIAERVQGRRVAKVLVRLADDRQPEPASG